MRVQIENLGAVKKADIEFGNLTVIAGENSTGKTSIVYTAWDILNSPEKYFAFIPSVQTASILSDFIHTLFKNKKAIINLDDMVDNLDQNYSEIFQVDNEQSKKNIGYVLSKKINDDFKLRIHDIKKTKCTNGYQTNFTIDLKKIIDSLSMDNNNSAKFSFNATVNIILVMNFDIHSHNFNVKIDWNLVRTQDVFPISKEAYDKACAYEIEYRDILDYSNYDILSKHILHGLMAVITAERTLTVISTSERAGIISFITDYVDKKIDNNHERKYRTLTHTAPVQNNIQLTNELSRAISNRSIEAEINNDENIAYNTNLSHIYEEIEQMIGGRLFVEKSTGDIKFKLFPKKGTDKGETQEFIDYRNLSSSIKSITMIYFQLKYNLFLSSHDINTTKFSSYGYYAKDTYYIIDEPEAFLHPSNQTRMARIIAMMVNAGIKVIITTHSDFLIRELNALITLGSINIPDKSVLKNYDDLKENMTLNINHKIINIYALHKDGYAVKQKLNKYGMTLDTFNDAMGKQNKLFNFVGKMVRKDKEL